MVKICVIIPVYNAEKYIAFCIESICHQSFKDFELILIDDGSTDGSSLICDKFAKIDDRIKVIHQNNRGLSRTRNLGIDKSISEYIAFADADDYYENNFLEECISRIEKDNSDFVFTATIKEYYREDKLYKSEYYPNWNDKTCTVNQMPNSIWIDFSFINMLTAWGKIYKSKIIKENNIRFLEDVTPHEDSCFNFDYLSVINKVSIVSSYFYHYRIENNESLMHAYRPNIYEITCQFCQRFNKFINRFQVNKKTYKFYKQTIFAMFIECAMHFYKFQKLTTKCQRIENLKNIMDNTDFQNVKYSDLNSIKNIAYLFMLKNSMIHVINYIFSRKYNI